MFAVYYHYGRTETISKHATRREALDECARLNECNSGETGYFTTDADLFVWGEGKHRSSLEMLQRARLHGDEDAGCVTVRTYECDDVQIPESDIKSMLAECE